MAAEASEATAGRLLGTIMAGCEPVRLFPLAGVAREVLGPGLRVTFAGNYALYYRHDAHELILVRVLHGARDVAVVVSQGGFDA